LVKERRGEERRGEERRRGAQLCAKMRGGEKNSIRRQKEREEKREKNMIFIVGS
jgi:hypothetical protein